MKKGKAHISLRQKLASALAHLMVEVDGKLERAIPHEDARKMTAEDIISLYNFDHNIFEAIGGPAEHWNLTPRFIAEHRRKTAKHDLPAIAKSDRLSADHVAFQRRILAKGEKSRESDAEIMTTKPRKKIPSRPFQKKPEGHKHFRSKGSTR